MTWRAEVDSTFDKARRKEAYRRFARIVRRREPADLPDLEAIRTRFRLFDQNYVGIRSIPVADIVGTTDRSSAFGGDFLPRRAQMRERWQRVERAFPQGAFPPISVYQLGERYYVSDGRHRVAIAKQRKAEFIDAEVTRLHARFAIPVDADIGLLILREQERIFMDESELERARPEAQVHFTRPQGYIELLELLKGHGYELARETGRVPHMHEVAGDWYDRVYLPTVGAIRRAGLTEAWPEARDADLFLLVWQRRRSLFPERGPMSLEDAAKSARGESAGAEGSGDAVKRAAHSGRPRAHRPATDGAVTPYGSPPAWGEELSITKSARLLACSSPNGDMAGARLSPHGLWANDTRHLSRLVLTAPGVVARQRDVGHSLSERAVIRNGDTGPVTLGAVLELASDFADMFEARGLATPIARDVTVALTERSARFSYAGLDGALRTTTATLEPPPSRLVATRAATGRAPGDPEPGGPELPAETPPEPQTWIPIVHASWSMELGPGAQTTLEWKITTSDGEDAEHDARPPLRLPRPKVANPVLEDLLEVSAGDLEALWTSHPAGSYIAAGAPYYVALFGRDALITALELLAVAPEVARGTLGALAAQQADAPNPRRDAEPGKILHERRAGELAGAGLIPQSPYYGTVDATPLFVLVAALLWRRSGDTAALERLLPRVEAALGWIDHHGDRDGDGFIEYARRAPVGLVNQGWKDSPDAIVHRGGAVAAGPIALVEAQAYVYAAKRAWAGALAALGRHDRAAALSREAEALRERFEAAFWMEDEACYALALDGSKRQVASVTSNAGHALACGIASPERARRVTERLMAPDMFGGWGVRTLSSLSPAYDPASYHRGSVWPHDTLACAAGFKRYGFDDAFARLAAALIDAGAASPGLRLPELLGGDERIPGKPYVPYSTACAPQAWSAGVPFALAALLRQEPG